MKKQFIAAGFFIVSLISPLKAWAADFSQIYVFGDSLSDTGNTFNVTGGLSNPQNAFPPDPPYSNGRFSNGKLWIEYFGDELGGLTPPLYTDLLVSPNTTAPKGVNYSFAGSSTGLGNAVRPDAPLPGVLAQANLLTQGFIANNQQVDPNALYVVWGGANDYFFGGATDVSQPVTNLSNAVGLLASAGAKNIMVFNLPDLGKVPAKVNTAESSQLSALTTAHNTSLAAALGSFSTIPNINIIPVDVYSLFNRAVNNPSEFGFTNVRDSCVNLSTFVPCTNQDEFLFYDDFHPTTATHRLVANAALAAVGYKSASASVPEPSTALGILALGVGAAAVLKRKQKQSAIAHSPAAKPYAPASRALITLEKN